MKKILIFLFICSLASVNSCKRQLIESPTSTIAPVNFYKTQADFETATLGAIGIHAGLDLYGWAWQIVLGYTDGALNLAGSEWWQMTYDGNWSFTAQMWNANYKLINNINMTLEHLEEVDFNIERKNALKGELLFLRATAYFDLVRLFGKVPVHLISTSSLDNISLPESSIAEVYQTIIDDLTEAESILNITSPYGVGYATKGSATGLLVKVYVFMAGEPLTDASKWTVALEQAKKIVDVNNPSQSAAPYNYRLEPDYQNLFNLVISPAYSGAGGTAKPVIGKAAIENGLEAVYEINYKTSAGVLSSAFPTSISGISAPDWIWNYMDTFDYRKQVTYINTKTDPLGPLRLQKKFQTTGTTWNDNDNNWPYLRFANLTLFLAEAENEVNGPTPLAFSAINAIRERARNAAGTMRTVPADYTAADAPTKEEFRELIYKERILEFSCESENWLDYIRTGTLQQFTTLQGRGAFYKPRVEFFPKPQTQITLSKGNISQNTGY